MSGLFQGVPRWLHRAVRHVGDQAAVDHVLRAGGERRLLAGEEDDERGHFFGSAGAPDSPSPHDTENQ